MNEAEKRDILLGIFAKALMKAPDTQHAYFRSWYPQVRELMRAKFPESAPCPRCEAAMGELCECFAADGEWIIQEGDRAMRERINGGPL